MLIEKGGEDMQRILIVDDNQDIREVLGTYVAKEGFEPVVADRKSVV